MQNETPKIIIGRKEERTKIKKRIGSKEAEFIALYVEGESEKPFSFATQLKKQNSLPLKLQG